METEEVHGRYIGRPTLGLFGPPQVHRQLRCLMKLRRELCSRHVADDDAGTFQRDEPAFDQGLHLWEKRLDPLAPINGDSDQWQILGQRQQPLRVEPVLDSEALESRAAGCWPARLPTRIAP